jgi:hypothetical protein
MLVNVSKAAKIGNRAAYHMKGVVTFPEHYIMSVNTWLITEGINIRRGHSSPGNLHFEQVLSYGFRQIPQTSSSGMSQRQAATAFHSLIVTFILPYQSRIEGGAARKVDGGQHTRLMQGQYISAVSGAACQGSLRV